MKIDIVEDEPQVPEKPKKTLRFRDPERNRRKKRNYEQNRRQRIEWNTAMSSGRKPDVEEPPHGLNKLKVQNHPKKD